MALRLVTPPASPGLITLDQAKAQCRVDFDDDDELITDFIAEASDLVQTMTARRYLPSVWEWELEAWHDPMVLPIAPCSQWDQVTVNSITFGDLAGHTETLDPSVYWVRPAGQTVKIVKRWFVIWPWLGDAPERVIINFSVNEPAGEPPVAPNVPPRVQRAVRLLVSHYYENRDAVVGVDARDSSTELPLGVTQHLYGEFWQEPAKV